MATVAPATPGTLLPATRSARSQKGPARGCTVSGALPICRHQFDSRALLWTRLCYIAAKFVGGGTFEQRNNIAV